ncbi:MAG: EF-Tu/IF-2/RF-3 family GTPase [Thermoplasmatota archaeon]
MEHAIVTLLGQNDWARSVGKETSSTSFGIGALKKDDRVVTMVYPSKYPEKIWSLLFPISLSESVYLNIVRIDRELGETIIALDLVQKNVGNIHVGPLVDISLLGTIIKDTVVENYQNFDPDPALFRETLFEVPIPMVQDGCDVVIDQAFNVKGVGCVALGFVTRGAVRKHQNLAVYPARKRTIVRSIQVHDRDHEEAPTGARVGLALKNIEPEDLPRGSLLTSSDEGLVSSDHHSGRFRVSKYWKEEIPEGARFHLWNSLQFVPVQLRNIDQGGPGEREIICDLQLDGQLWVKKGDRLGLSFLDSKSFRLFAAGESI